MIVLFLSFRFDLFDLLRIIVILIEWNLPNS